MPVDAAPRVPKTDKANYASDTGVTADVVRIGAINMTSASRSLGPPIAGTQENTLHAVVNYLNKTGGVAGRRVELVLCDDGGDIARGRACYERLKGEVFALMPSVSWLSDVIHDSLGRDKLPWMSWGWFKSEYQDPWMFPCHANGEREAQAAADWVGKVMKPKGVKSVGIMYLNVSEDINAAKILEAGVKKHGIEVKAKIAQEWDSPDESQHVLQMRSANPDMILSWSWPAPVAKFFHDADAQRYAPPQGYLANHLTGDPGFQPIFGDHIKDRTYTITSWSVPGVGPNQDASTPEHKLHADEMQQTNGKEYGGFKFRYYGGHHITQSGWACGRIFQKAAAELGPDLTREGFKTVLESRGWDSGMGVTLYWPKGNHDGLPYSFNREFVYKWVSHKDGGADMERIHPDPVADCKAGNIPAGAKTICG
jgi:ABC-type branched-subunit amino acid transport system substrate-binding protein